MKITRLEGAHTSVGEIAARDERDDVVGDIAAWDDFLLLLVEEDDDMLMSLEKDVVLLLMKKMMI